jgi:6-pyruvoyltetrahydropterin/6-carboxytetrahydropterin synthase
VFSAAHSLRDYVGPCSNVHGHNWGVEIVVRGEKLQSNGMLVDFGDVKEATADVLSRLDHHHLNEAPPFDEINPTSENLARWIFDQVSKRVNAGDLRVVRVNVREAETSCASYFGDAGEDQ